jgi:autotransporter strand-loop-strand O-heptosyltransferase
LILSVHECWFLTAAQIDPRDYYDAYKLFIFYNDDHNLWQPCDYRQVGLYHTTAYILGMPAVDERPWIITEPGGPPIFESYVCIAAQVTSQNKRWNNPQSWHAIITFLRHLVIALPVSTRSPFVANAARIISIGTRDWTRVSN